MNMKKLIAALLLAVMLLSAVSAFAASFKKGENVFFSGSAYGYKSHNARHKTKTIVTKGSWSYAMEAQNGNWVRVYLDTNKSLWFNKKYLNHVYKGTKEWVAVELYKAKCALFGLDVDHFICYGSGGYGRSTMRELYVDPDAAKYDYVKADGKCNIRAGAGLAYDTFGTFKKGKKLEYLGAYGVDTRGVCWFMVRYDKSKNDGKIAFVSELYTHRT